MNLTFPSSPSTLADLEGGKHFFNTVREGDSVLFATEDEQDAHNWVMAFYRATGQVNVAHGCRPRPRLRELSLPARDGITQPIGHTFLALSVDAAIRGFYYTMSSLGSLALSSDSRITDRCSIVLPAGAQTPPAGHNGEELCAAQRGWRR